jgi:hypothetical protein
VNITISYIKNFQCVNYVFQLKQPTLNMMLQGMAAAAAGHPGSLHHALQSPPNSNAAAMNPAGGFLFLPQNPNAGMQGQQMHPGKTNPLFTCDLKV